MILYDKIPPNSLQAEKTLLGTLLIAPYLVADLKANLSPMSLYVSQNREIYAAMVEMSDCGTAIDIITLCDSLKRRGTLEDVGGECYLAELSENIAVPENVGEYLKIIADKHIRRDVIAEATEIVAKAFDEEASIDKILRSVEKLGTKISEECDKAEIKRRRRGEIICVNSLTQQIKDYREKGFNNLGVCPGQKWPLLTEHYKPAKGTLNIVTGIPGHGKSEFMDDLMVNIALENDWRWAVFTPENYPWEMYMQKLSEKLLGKRFWEMNLGEVETALEWLNAHFYLIEPDEENITVDSLLNLELEAIQKFNINGALWDPWNEIEVSLKGQENETSYIGRSLGRIRRFARRHSVAQFIVAHPAKMLKDLKTKKYLIPTPYDISGSSNWYNKADNCLCVYRNFDIQVIDIHIQKIKFKVHGKVGCVPMTYDRASGRFNETKPDNANKPDPNQTNIWQNQ